MAHHVRAHHDPSDFLNSDLPVPNIQNAKASVLISMASKNKRSTKVQHDRVSKPTKQQNNKKKGPKKKTQPKRMLPTPLGPEANTVEEQPILPLPQEPLIYNTNTETILNQFQTFQNTPASLPCNQDFDFENELFNFPPDDIVENGLFDITGTEGPDLACVPEIFSVGPVGNADCPTEEDVFALIDSEGIVDEVQDDSMMFLAVSSDDTTDAEMESLAHFSRDITPPILSLESDIFQIHSPFQL